MKPINFGGKKSKVKIGKRLYNLVNTIEIKLLSVLWSNLRRLLPIIGGWTILICKVMDKRSLGQWTNIEVIL